MRRTFLFGILVFMAGWFFQVTLLRFFSGRDIFPQVLLLIVVAFGMAGFTNLAQTLGFFWGLALDTQGLSPFGAQALFLCWAGHAAGRLSYLWDIEKSVTQWALAALATLLFNGGVFLAALIVRPASDFSFEMALGLLVRLFFNVFLAPAVFWLVQQMMAVWMIMVERKPYA